MTDPILIEESRQGNMRSFRKLIEDTSPMIYSVAYKMLGRTEEVNDIVQETMISIWQNLSKIRSVEAYRKWVYRIAVNKCYDNLREKKNSFENTADDLTWKLIAGQTEDNGLTQLESEESVRIISLLTAHLSPKQKTVFVLSEVECLSHEEISEITGMNRNTIKANLHYARQTITGLMEKYI